MTMLKFCLFLFLQKLIWLEKLKKKIQIICVFSPDFFSILPHIYIISPIRNILMLKTNILNFNHIQFYKLIK